MIKYNCRKCNRDFHFDEHKSIKYCPDCGTKLELIRYYDPDPTVGSDGRKKLTPEEAQISKLWPIYLNSTIEVTAKFTFPSAQEWVRRRKLVYVEYRRRFSPENLKNLNSVKNNFHNWLIFRNNLSWTTFQRTGSIAIENPQKLANLLGYLQDENIDIATRIRGALQGSYKIDRLADGVVTALLHTFNNEKYGVWNSRTNDTLKKLHKPVLATEDSGESYIRVNNTLKQLAKETNSDLTTLDGFMWFVSKNYTFL